MSYAAGPAVMQALALFAAPRGWRPRAQDPLPEGMLVLIKIAAGDEQEIAAARSHSGETRERVSDASRFYIQQVMFAGDADSYRILGVNSDAADSQAREHYRWLARWLHPDRNPDEWEAVYADRVNRAWQDLRTPDRRLEFDRGRDEQLANEPEPEFEALRAPMLHIEQAPPSGAGLNLRWLPSAILGTLGVCAVAGLGLFYVLETRGLNSSGGSQEQQTIAGAPAADELAQTSSRSQELLPELEPPRQFLSGAQIAPSTTEPLPLTVDIPQAASQPADAPAPAAAPVPPPVPVKMAAAPAARDHSPVESVAKEVRPPPAPLPKSDRSVAGVDVRRVAQAAPVAQPPSAPVVEIETPVPTDATDRLKTEERGTVESTADETADFSSRDANRLLGTFSRAFRNGDVSSMRAIFSSDPAMGAAGLNTVLSDYDRLFASTRARSLNMRNVSWFRSGRTLTIIASFDASVTQGEDGRERKTTGDLRFDLRQEPSGWRIVRVKHDERPG